MTARAPGPTEVATEKAAWRRRIRAARRARLPEVRARHAALLTDAALELADGIDGPICAHLPVGVEPWSASGVEALRAAGHEVLLPVVTDRAGPLDWSRFDGPDALVAGPFGLREPAGVRLGPQAVRRARAGAAPRAGRRTGEECGSGRAAGSTTGRCRWSTPTSRSWSCSTTGSWSTRCPPNPTTVG